MEIGWRFPPLSGGTKQGYTNNDIEGFKGEELIDNLAREICQNSLDAHDQTVREPVKVVFQLKQVDTNSYTVFFEYEKCLKGCREFWSRGGSIDAKLDSFLKEAETTLRKPKISILVASDYNTRGLCGNHDLDKISSSWEALTGADGMSVKPDDNSGGSFGIGKNAPFACSALSMVFYNTFDADSNKAFIGVGRLATLLNTFGKPTQRVGRYQKNDDDNEEWLPIYEEDENSFRDLFDRNEKGTDIIIVGFNGVENWRDNVSKAVIKNFFVAIQEKNLIVEVNDGETINIIDDSSIAEKIEEYAKNDNDFDITRQLYLAFTEPDNHTPITIFGEENAIDIYIKSESSFSRSIANFRSTGMLVGKGYRRIFQHYAAVLIVRGESLGKLLRATEPPRHNRWDYKLINGEAEKDKRKQAKEALSIIDNELLKLLKAQYEVPAEKFTDAVGVSAYLPDADDGAIPEESNGSDILKPKIKIGKTKIKKNKPVVMNFPGVETEGGEDEGNTGDRGVRIGPVGPTPKPGPLPGPGPGPVPGPNPGPAPDKVVGPDGDTTQGVSRGNGQRTITIKELSKRRAFLMSDAIGLYKIIIKPEKDYEKLFVECVVAGEDGKADELRINKFMYNGQTVRSVGGKAGPIRVKKDIPAEFMVTFDTKEKMGLNLILSEGESR